MRISTTLRAASLAVAVALLAFALTGCGDDNDSSKTGAGAPAGATGNAAGGAAVEAGKVRDQSDVEQEKKTFSEEPPPIQIQLGDESGFVVTKPTVEVARSNAEMKKLKKKVFSRGVESRPIPPTDYATRQTVLVQLPSQPKGTQMQVQDIHQEGSKMVVTAVRLLNGKGCKTTGSRPNPFDIVETRRMSGTPSLKINTQRQTAC